MDFILTRFKVSPNTYTHNKESPCLKTARAFTYYSVGVLELAIFESTSNKANALLMIYLFYFISFNYLVLNITTKIKNLFNDTNKLVSEF